MHRATSDLLKGLRLVKMKMNMFLGWQKNPLRISKCNMGERI